MYIYIYLHVLLHWVQFYTKVLKSVHRSPLPAVLIWQRADSDLSLRSQKAFFVFLRYLLVNASRDNVPMSWLFFLFEWPKLTNFTLSQSLPPFHLGAEFGGIGIVPGWQVGDCDKVIPNGIQFPVSSSDLDKFTQGQGRAVNFEAQKASIPICSVPHTTCSCHSGR